MNYTDQSGNRSPQFYNILSCFALPAAVAARIAEDGDSHDHEALAVNAALPLEAAVLIGETSRNYHALQNILHNVRHPDVLHAVLSQRRETRKTVLISIIMAWNMDEAAQQQLVDRRLPDDIADMYLHNRCWFPEPAAKAVLMASGPVAVEYLAELADTDLDDETLAAVAVTIIENTEKLYLTGKQIAASKQLAEACWLRPVVKNAALNSGAATAVAALTQIGLTADETETTVNKIAGIDCPRLAGHAAKQLLMNPTVTTETRLLIAEQYPAAAGDAAAAGAHRTDTTITGGRQLRNIDDLDILDKAVAGTSAFTHLADLIEHPATTRDPHILHRLLKLSETQAEQTGPLRRKLLTHIIKLRRDNDLANTFTKTTHDWRRMQSQAADGNADRDAAAQKGTHPRYEMARQGPGTSWQGRRREDTETTDTVAQQPVGEVQHRQLRLLGEYWLNQLGEGGSDESATAWQTALDMVCAVPEQSSVDIIKLAKTLGAGA